MSSSLLRSLLATALALVLPHAAAAAPLKVGVSAVTAPSLEVAAEQARQQGLDVQVIEFSDWTTPNEALAAGDLDANFFQHLPFLENATRARGYRFKVVDVGVLMNIGLFSRHVNSVDAIADKATISVYDDATNQGRHLLFLQKLGLIQLKADAGDNPSLLDIASNPKNLKFVEIPGPQLARAFADVDVATGAPLFFVAAGQHDIARGGLAYSGAEDVKYAIHFVAREDNAHDPRLAQLVRIYQDSPAVREHIHASLSNDENLYVLPWLAAR